MLSYKTRSGIIFKRLFTKEQWTKEKSCTFSNSIQQKNGVARIEPSSVGILVTGTFQRNID